MLSWLGKLIGTEKAVSNLVDKDNGLLAQAGSWLGGLNYTAEEKAEADKATREWGVRQLEALAPFKVVQRILAFATALLWIVAGLIYMLAVFLEGYSNKGVEAAHDKLILVAPLKEFIFSDYILWPTFTVFALYFSGGVISSLKGKKV